MNLSSLTLSFSAGSCAMPDRGSLQHAGIATTAFNPLARPGELVVIIANSNGAALSGKLAVKLAVEHFTEAVLELPAKIEPTKDSERFGAGVHKPRAVALLEAGFERANGQIYAFGHKLAAGGTLSASIIAIAISDGELAAAKVGDGDVQLERAGENVWLFSAQNTNDPRSSSGPNIDPAVFDSTVLVGAHKQVPVDFLHLGIQPHDSVKLHSAVKDVGGKDDIFWFISIGPSAVFLDAPA